MLIADSDFSGTITRRAGGGWNAEIHAARLDARRMVKEATSDSGPGSPAPLAINARIDRLRSAPSTRSRRSRLRCCAPAASGNPPASTAGLPMAISWGCGSARVAGGG